MIRRLPLLLALSLGSCSTLGPWYELDNDTSCRDERFHLSGRTITHCTATWTHSSTHLPPNK